MEQLITNHENLAKEPTSKMDGMHFYLYKKFDVLTN